LAGNILQARRYSQAVFELARDRNEIEKWQKDLQKISFLAKIPEFVAVMENPQFSFEKKSRLLQGQLQGVSKMANSLAFILTEQGKFSLISAIDEEFQQLLYGFRNIAQAEVTTAVPLDDDEKSKLAERLGKITGKKVILTTKVDPEIIGGMIARVGGKIIDGSTSSQLRALKSELVNAGE